MRAVQAGKRAAYTTLFMRYQAAIYGYALRMTRRKELAEEVFQDTFLSVHRARGSFDPRMGSFRSWLYRIATNTLRDRARSAARRPEVEVAEWDGASQSPPESKLMLERALAALPEPLRDAFLLGVVGGLDHNEIATALGITPDNARARLSRARLKLRETLEVA